MLDNPVENGMVERLRRLQDWWLEVPLSYRVNALLYAGGGLLLLFLLVTLLTGDGSAPRQIQVGAAGRAPNTTAKLDPPPASPAGVASTSTLPMTSPTTSISVPRASTAQAAGGAPAGGSGATNGGDDTTTTTEVTTTTTEATTTTTTTTTTMAPCRNSQEPRCGNFSWDPAPGPNQPLTVSVVLKTAQPKVGEPVLFEVTVSDPDHPVSDYCAEVRYGDGGNDDGPCNPPPGCPPHHGPWTPPERQSGGYTRQYSHTYREAGTFDARFTYRSWSPSRCLGLDPYASSDERTVTLTIPPGT